MHLITGREVMATYGIRRRRQFVGNLFKVTQVSLIVAEASRDSGILFPYLLSFAGFSVQAPGSWVLAHQ